MVAPAEWTTIYRHPSARAVARRGARRGVSDHGVAASPARTEPSIDRAQQPGRGTERRRGPGDEDHAVRPPPVLRGPREPADGNVDPGRHEPDEAGAGVPG